MSDKRSSVTTRAVTCPVCERLVMSHNMRYDTHETADVGMHVRCEGSGRYVTANGGSAS